MPDGSLKVGVNLILKLRDEESPIVSRFTDDIKIA